jgi:hypothetical protein
VLEVPVEGRDRKPGELGGLCRLRGIEKINDCFLVNLHQLGIWMQRLRKNSL